MVVLFFRSSVVVFYANLVSGSLIGPFVPRGTKYRSLIGYGAVSRGILLCTTNVSVTVVVNEREIEVLFCYDLSCL